MPIVCTYKPNRTKPRPFTEKDLRRIAKYVNEGGIPWFKILAAAAVGAGVGYLLCKLAQSVKNLSGLLGFVKQLALIATSAVAIRVLIEWLKKGKVARIPLVNRFALVLVIVLTIVEKIIESLSSVLDDVIFLEEIVDSLESACETVHDLVQGLKKDNKLDQLSEQDRLLAL